MKNTYEIVEYNGEKYVVATTTEGEPFIFDLDILPKLPEKSFFKRGQYISCTHDLAAIYLHHIVKPYSGISVDHINQIKTDNRSRNLRYATQSEQNMNQSKRTRNVELPEHCGVSPNDIPTFMWYSKAWENHGDSWVVELDGKAWKTTKQKNVSTKCKFEIAKKYIRNLIASNPNIVQQRSVNGELPMHAKKLAIEYAEILKLAGFVYIPKFSRNLLEEDVSGLDAKEIELVRAFNNANGNRPMCKLPIDCGVTPDQIPKYCWYCPATTAKGDAFAVSKTHPKQIAAGKTDWYTTKKRSVTTKEKYEMLLAYLNSA